MKKLCVFMAIILLFTLVSGCKEKPADPTKATNLADPTEITGNTQSKQTDDTIEAEPVVKVQDSKNIMSMRGVISGNSSDEYWSERYTEKAVAEYAKTYTPFVSKMDNGVLTEGVTEMSFEPDCKYAIVNCKVTKVARVDDSDPEVERDYAGGKAKAKFDGRKVTVDFGWWHETDHWTKTHTDWSYGVCVEDKGGNFYNYYFRVQYATTDPVGLFTEADYASYLSQRWYRNALGCIFATPEEIPIEYFLYGGVNFYEPETEEERIYFQETYNSRVPNVKVPVEKMNEALSILGVTAADVKIPSYWKYFDKEDAYYFSRTDAYDFGKWSVTKVEKEEDGIVKVYQKVEKHWFSNYPDDFVIMVLTMQLQEDGTYRLLSNMPQDPIELPPEGAVAYIFHTNRYNQPA